MTMVVDLDGNIIDSEAFFHIAFREASGVEWYVGERFDRLLTVIFDAIAHRGDGSIKLRLES